MEKRQEKKKKKKKLQGNLVNSTHWEKKGV
jgi:hypothetical protein